MPTGRPPPPPGPPPFGGGDFSSSSSSWASWSSSSSSSVPNGKAHTPPPHFEHDAASSSGSSLSNPGLITAIVVPIIVIILAIGGLCLFLRRRRRNRNNTAYPHLADEAKPRLLSSSSSTSPSTASTAAPPAIPRANEPRPFSPPMLERTRNQDQNPIILTPLNRAYLTGIDTSSQGSQTRPASYIDAEPGALIDFDFQRSSSLREPPPPPYKARLSGIPPGADEGEAPPEVVGGGGEVYRHLPSAFDLSIPAASSSAVTRDAPVEASPFGDQHRYSYQDDDDDAEFAVADGLLHRDREVDVDHHDNEVSDPFTDPDNLLAVSERGEALEREMRAELERRGLGRSER